MITSPNFRTSARLGNSAFRIGAALLFALVCLSACNPALAQDERKRKIPVVDKLSSGVNHQAFTGTVASVDMQQHVLELNARESKDLEIFPVKKGVSISTADGKKTKLADLTPGTSVMVYYDQKGDRRTVKEIVVLGASEAGKKKAPSS